LGKRLFMRVPLPAAIMTTSTGMVLSGSLLEEIMGFPMDANRCARC
jgi:hypothetical protein